VPISSRLKIRPPQDATAIHEVTPSELHLSGGLNRPTRLDAVFLVDWDRNRYENADGAYSAAELWCQQRSYVTHQLNDTYKLRGRIHAVSRTLWEGKPAIAITAFCKLQALNETYAAYKPGSETYYAFTRRCGPVAISQVRLYPGVHFTGGAKNTWYPDAANASAWLSTSYLSAAGYSDTLAANINNSVTEIKLSTSNKAFPQSGFVSINSEWIEYNGYTWNQADGYYWLNNCNRGRLGTTAAAHLAADTCYARIPCRVHDLSPFYVEGYDGSAWFAIENSNYEPNYEENSFAFKGDPLAMARQDGAGAGTPDAYTQIRASYDVNDEEDAGGTQLLLSDCITDILKITQADLGPGFLPTAPETCTASASLSPDIPLTRFVVERPVTVWAAITTALGDLGLNKGAENDVILVRYNSETDALELKSIGQAATPDRRYSGEQGWTQTVALDDVRSAIIARYTGQERENLISSDRMQHTVATDTSLGGDFTREPFVHHKINNAWYGHASAIYYNGASVETLVPYARRLTQNYEANAGNANLMTDNEVNTGFAMSWETQPADATQLYAWFPGASSTAPDLVWLERIVLNLDIKGESASGTANMLDLQVQGYDTFTGNFTGAPTTGTAFNLGPQSRIVYTPGTWDSTEPVTVEIVLPSPVLCRAIGLYFRDMLVFPDGELHSTNSYDGRFGFKINDIAAYGIPYRTQVMKTKATYATTDSGTVTAPDTHLKLVDASMGQHLVGTIELGAATHKTAANYAWLQLIQNFSVPERRTCTIISEGIGDTTGGGVPVVGETAQFSDGTAGIIEGFEYSEVGGRRSLTLQTVNYNAALFGSAI
jgi:hypothetical protein